MSNILDAILNIIEVNKFTVDNLYKGSNKINNVGDALEEYAKDAFAGSFNLTTKAKKNKAYSKTFSYLGNSNNPPDFMIRGGAAVEVKKITSLKSEIALNSSYPKATIRSDNPMITHSCRDSEEWTEKDLIYLIGRVKPKTSKITSLWFVYGSIYAASHETYTRIKDKITEGVSEIPGIEISKTKELGRINKVDPLGITYLRVRGMWGIKNPAVVFDYIHTTNSDNEFELTALIPNDVYAEFDKKSKRRFTEKVKTTSMLKIEDEKVQNPNNPAILVDCKLITFSL